MKAEITVMTKEIESKLNDLRNLQARINSARSSIFTYVPPRTKGIKGLFKRFIHKSMLSMLAPFKTQLNAYIELERCLMEEVEDILSDVSEKLIRDDYDEKKYREAEGENMRTAVRELMSLKWQSIDAKRPLIESPEDMLTCKICGGSHRRGEYKLMTAECQFGGGALERYVCPDCGALFGPSKFAVLSDEKKGEDYALHYRGYDEGDSQEKELKAFYMLEPDKEKRYLDYGCGRWSGTVKLLRERGYNVFGYEPYASETGNPYIISKKEDISRLRFDGIFSNDLVEHLFDPVADFKFMRTLLKDETSKMSHSTSCYEYVHETTRFHTHFFMGDSVGVLCERSGFKLLERRDELEENDFICCIFGIDGDFKTQCSAEGVELLPRLFLKGERLTGRQSCSTEPGDVLYGPYTTFAPMKYTLKICATTGDSLAVKLTSLMGAHTLWEGRIDSGENMIEFSCDRIEYDAEVVITNDSLCTAEITGVSLV